jgi:hypothetical protein
MGSASLIYHEPACEYPLLQLWGGGKYAFLLWGRGWDCFLTSLVTYCRTFP